jgi:hypothetical protein
MAQSRITSKDLDDIFIPRIASRSKSMLNYLRHASNRGKDKLNLTIDDFEYRILLMLCAVGNIIIESRTPTTVTIIVEKP